MNGVVYLVVMLSNIQTSIIRVFTIANLAELANLRIELLEDMLEGK